MEERQLIIKVLADEYHAADALRAIANYIESAESDEAIDGAELEDYHFSATIDYE